MKKSKFCIKLLIMLAIILISFFICGQVKAGTISLNSLDFQIQLKEDGSMDVIENWDAQISNTNTMFKDIHLDSTKFKNITNVEVYRVEGSNKTKLTQIYEEMYHVTKNCYYGLVTSSGDFEIAWGVSVNSKENRKYQIKYTVLDAIKTYTDCSELYWQLVGNENTIPVKKLTATIKMPSSVDSKNNLRAWAHGPYNGNISLTNDTVTVDLDYLDEETMVEVRIATIENLFPQNTVIPRARFNTILSEEGKWADKANEEREAYIKEKERQDKIEKMITIAMIAANIILGIVFLILFIRNYKKAKNIPKREKVDLEYFRDFPDKTASAGDAAFLYYYRNGNFASNISKVLSATLLQLSLKKYIVFSEDNSERKPDIRISILDNSDKINEMVPLKNDEQIVYNLLIKVADSTKNEIRTFTMKEFEKYAKKHSSSFVSEINKIEGKVKTQQQELGNYNKQIEKAASNQVGFIVLEIVFGLILLFMPIASIMLFLNIIPSANLYKKLNALTDKGFNEATQWKALKKYMEDFSLLNEKEVPDLRLWEKYLVYATAFGISDKVLKQLKIRYPELQEIDGYDYVYMNLLYRSSLNTAFLTTFNNSVNKAYMGGLSANASSNYSGGNFSSGGGFGGGFSGGGGFGGGGGRNGR